MSSLAIQERGCLPRCDARSAPAAKLDIGRVRPNLALMVLRDPSSPAAPRHRTSLSARIVAEQPKLRRHAMSLLYNRADADDLVQDCLEAALAKQQMLEHPDRLRSWLFAILNNLFLSRLRSKARRGTALPIEDFSDNLAASVPAEDRGTALDLGRAMGRL